MDRYYVNDGGEVEDSHRPDGCQTLDEVEIVMLLNQLADRDAEIERLRADLVWSVKHGAFLHHEIEDEPAVFAWFVFGFGGEPEMEKCDGTPESICRAVREARDGE